MRASTKGLAVAVAFLVAAGGVSLTRAWAAEVLQNGGFEIGAGAASWNLTQVTSGGPPTGDYNNNGVVDAADYVVWRDTNLNGQQGYDDWKANFGSTGSGGQFVSATELVDFANEPMGVEGELGLLIKPFAGNVGSYQGQNQKVNVSLSQIVTFGPAAVGRTFTLTGHAFFQAAASNIINTLYPDSPSGEVPSPTVTKFEMAFLDTNDAVLGSPVELDMRSDGTTEAWRTHMLQGVAPASTTKIRVRAFANDMVASCTDACPAGQDVYFDNFVLTASGSAIPNWLQNGNLNTPGAPTNWTIEKTAQDNIQFSTQSYAIHTGNVGVWLRSFAGGDAKVVQTVAGTPGGSYTLSGWSKWETGYNGADPLSSTQTFMTMEFLDGSNAVIGTDSLDLRTVQINDDTWRQFSVNGVAPAGTVNIRVSAGAIGMANSGINPQSAMFDDFSLVLAGSGSGNLLLAGVPEPGACALALIGLAACLFGRRRSA